MFFWHFVAQSIVGYCLLFAESPTRREFPLNRKLESDRRTNLSRGLIQLICCHHQVRRIGSMPVNMSLHDSCIKTLRSDWSYFSSKERMKGGSCCAKLIVFPGNKCSQKHFWTGVRSVWITESQTVVREAKSRGNREVTFRQRTSVHRIFNHRGRCSVWKPVFHKKSRAILVYGHLFILLFFKLYFHEPQTTRGPTKCWIRI